MTTEKEIDAKTQYQTFSGEIRCHFAFQSVVLAGKKGGEELAP